MKMKMVFHDWLIVCISLLLLFLFPTFCLAANFCVSNETDLQSALTFAASNGENDTIQIVQGTYNGNFVYASTEAYGVTIEGGYTSGCASREVDPANTILDGDATGNVLVLSCPDHTVEFMVDGLTLQNGNASNLGGGLFTITDNGEVTLTNNTISGNTSSHGGGVYANSSTLTLTNNTISGNNTITGNTSGYGGGVYANSSTLTLTNNTISGNTGSSLSYGGGLYADTYTTTITLTNNTITGNTAGYGGGGVYAIYPATLTLTNNTITGNTAANGGGVYVILLGNSDTAQVYNNIIYNNNANTDGDDLYINNDGNDDFIPSPVNLYNNDFDQSAAGTYIKIPFTIDSSNLNNTNPLFVSSGNYHLTLSSPCVNTGNNAAPSIPATDKDGNPRITGGIVDMGAYEYNPSAPVANAGPDQTVTQGTTVTLDGSASSDPGSQTLTYLWTQIGGTLVTLSDATTVQPTFTTPEADSLIFRLTVINTSDLKNTDNVGINVVTTPTVTTTEVSSVTSTSASSGGDVTSEGSSSVTARGVCWSTTANPTISDSKTTDGTGTGSFTSSITGLTPDTTYHVKAYATNSVETAYGSDVSFTTSYASTIYVSQDGTCGGKTTCHSTIQAAVEAASTGSVILIADGTYDEAITLNADKSLTLQGGWDSSFENQTGTTTLRNAPKAPQGSLTLQMLSIKPE